jgi:hypothetical protein
MLIHIAFRIGRERQGPVQGIPQLGRRLHVASQRCHGDQIARDLASLREIAGHRQCDIDCSIGVAEIGSALKINDGGVNGILYNQFLDPLGSVSQP